MKKERSIKKRRGRRPGGRTDPAERTFFANLFAGVAEEMGVTLARTAYSPNIKERRDFSCALFDARGRLVAQAAHVPVHLGAMSLSVAAALGAFGRLDEGDAVILNDPYAGGTHLPDITLVTPVAAEAAGGCGKPFMFLATRAHHADVGGMTPGSLPISREIHQEGLRLPPLKLYEKGRPNEAIFEILKANTRTPREREGDLRAQLAAQEVGSARLAEAIGKFGKRILAEKMEDLLEYGERLMGSVIGRIPDGEYVFEDFLDDDGLGGGPVKIRASVRIEGEGALVDFTGSDAECGGNMNCVEAITRSAVYYCFLCLLVTPRPTGRSGPVGPEVRGKEATLADPPLNAGCFSPIEVIAPEGTVVNARPPRAVAGGNVETSQRIVDAVLGALAEALPDAIPAASQGTMNNLTLGGIDPRRGGGGPFAYYETVAGGMGASPAADGPDAVQVHMTNTMNTPIEALEFAYPLRVERYEIASGTGGKGKRRGGCGVRREVRLLAAARGSLISERRRFPPYGLAGGEPGRRGENSLIKAGKGGKKKRLAAKVELDLEAGDAIVVRTPGGGGWGKPLR